MVEEMATGVGGAGKQSAGWTVVFGQISADVEETTRGLTRPEGRSGCSCGTGSGDGRGLAMMRVRESVKRGLVCTTMGGGDLERWSVVGRSSRRGPGVG